MSLFYRARKSKVSRMAAQFALLLTVLFLPWWILLVLVVFGSILFSSFWEAVVYAFLFDALYSLSVPHLHGFQFVVTVLTVIIVAVVEIVKQYLRV